MGRKVRMVPADWKHPKGEDGRYKPLNEGYTEDAKEFMSMANQKGLQEAVEYYGPAPDKNDYMPEWPDEEKTHLMMYETTSEGTPISPAFKTPEELARWLADNKASAFGSSTADYRSWLKVCKQGESVGAIYTPKTGLISGVEATTLIDGGMGEGE